MKDKLKIVISTGTRNKLYLNRDRMTLKIKLCEPIPDIVMLELVAELSRAANVVLEKKKYSVYFDECMGDSEEK